MSGTPRFPQFPIRINPKIMDKLKVIANEHSRSTGKEIEYLVIQCIKNYELEFGEITDTDIDNYYNSL